MELEDSRLVGEIVRIPHNDAHLVGKFIECGKKLVIFAHGLGAHKDQRFLAYLAAHLPGYSTIRFDMPGNGDSPGMFTLGYQAEVDAIDSVVNWALARGLAPTLVVGHSKGADEVLLHAAQRASVPAVVALSGRGDMAVQPEGRYSTQQMAQLASTGQFIKRFGDVDRVVTQAMMDERVSLDMRQISAIPPSVCVTVVHGTADEIIPYKDADLLTQYIGAGGCEATRVLFEGCDHGYHGFEARVRDLLADILAQVI
ncbi:Alpha/beta hydrolase family [Carpediemonas membranifera]|uniref:Alpha/beta hydrolase family n=1 Tax=Carpediemonas membranifera TaxID=201153 RepID=A0A8J6E9V1_9EUKA|nr:Alpha/beta hydrolase family [Carpediemonas membranifera]|eukprot:KAG9393850.1 Alpha/beta hydrolase family [Carpediemonas membranifera]